MNDEPKMTAAEEKRELEAHIASMLNEFFTAYYKRHGFVVNGIDVQFIETTRYSGQSDPVLGEVKLRLDA